LLNLVPQIAFAENFAGKRYFGLFGIVEFDFNSSGTLNVTHICGNGTYPGETANYTFNDGTNELTITVTEDPDGEEGVFEGVGTSLSLDVISQTTNTLTLRTPDNYTLTFTKELNKPSGALFDKFDDNYINPDFWSFSELNSGGSIVETNSSLIFFTTASPGHRNRIDMFARWSAPSLIDDLIIQADIAIASVNGNSNGHLSIPLYRSADGGIYEFQIGIESNSSSTDLNISKTNFFTRVALLDGGGGQPYSYRKQIKGMDIWHRAKFHYDSSERKGFFYLDGELIDQFALSPTDTLLGCNLGGGSFEFNSGCDGIPTAGGGLHRLTSSIIYALVLRAHSPTMLL
jgi:hypothetical protein